MISRSMPPLYAVALVVSTRLAHGAPPPRGAPRPTTPESTTSTASACQQLSTSQHAVDLYKAAIEVGRKQSYRRAVQLLRQALAVNVCSGELNDVQLTADARAKVLDYSRKIITRVLHVTPANAHVFVAKDLVNPDAPNGTIGAARATAARPGARATYTLELDPFAQQIKVQLEGYDHVDHSVGGDADPSPHAELDFELKALPVKLALDVEPRDATVELWSNDLGQQPVKLSMPDSRALPPDRGYILKFHRSGYVDSSETLKVLPSDQPLRVNARLDDTPVTSRPWMIAATLSAVSLLVGAGIYYAIIDQKPKDFDGGSTGLVMKF